MTHLHTDTLHTNILFQVMGCSVAPPLEGAQPVQVWCDVPAGLHSVLPSHGYPSLDSFTRTQLSHMCKCSQIHWHTRRQHAQTDLHLLPLCATSVHLIDDAMLWFFLTCIKTHSVSSSLLFLFCCPQSCPVCDLCLS